jgi:hypothetical protein
VKVKKHRRDVETESRVMMWAISCACASRSSTAQEASLHHVGVDCWDVVAVAGVGNVPGS